MVVTNRPKHEAKPGPEQEIGNSDDQRETHINERVLLEEDRPEEWNFGQHRNVEIRQFQAWNADEGLSDQAGEADAENGQARPVAT